MEAEISLKPNADKSERSDGRSGYRSGYRPRRLDTRLGTIYLMVPKVRQGGYIPFFVNAYKRSEAALVAVVQEAYVNGVFTRKIERLAKQLGVEGISRSQVSEMTKGLNEQVDEFRNRVLSSHTTIRSFGQIPSTKTSASTDMWSANRSSLSAVSMNTRSAMFWLLNQWRKNLWNPIRAFSAV